MLNLTALLKKKLLLQVRDPRTLIIEIFFPIIFIFVGLALANVKVFKDGIPRLLSPSLFPQPSHLYYNSPSFNDEKTDTFVTDYFGKDLWDTFGPVVIDTKGTTYVQQISQFDDYLYTKAQTIENGLFGNYFYYKLNEAKDNKYVIFALINVTSQDALAAYGTYIHQQFLRDVL